MYDFDVQYKQICVNFKIEFGKKLDKANERLIITAPRSAEFYLSLQF